MGKKNKRKNKGFTLIELMIVLAILGIIGLIAVPNFIKIREESKLKADKITATQIAKIVDIVEVEETISKNIYSLTFNSKKKLESLSPSNISLESYLTDINAPQKKGKTGFIINYVSEGNYEIKYNSGEEVLFEKWTSKKIESPSPDEEGSPSPDEEGSPSPDEEGSPSPDEEIEGYLDIRSEQTLQALNSVFKGEIIDDDDSLYTCKFHSRRLTECRRSYFETNGMRDDYYIYPKEEFLNCRN